MSKCLGDDSRIARNAEEDIHAEYDQEGSSSKSQVPKDLIKIKKQSTNKRPFLRPGASSGGRGYAHGLEGDHGLGIMAFQGTSTH